VIIVEGPDGGGKTTLIRQMQDRYGLEVAPRVVSKETTAMVDLKQWVEDNLSEGPQWKLFDRHRLISEPVYGPILRQYIEDGFDSMVWMMLQMRRFYEIEPLVVYCMPPLNVVRGNVQNDPDNKAVAWKIEAVYQAYAARAAIDYSLSPGSTIIWDYTADGRELDPLLALDGHVEMMKRRTHA
jgi:hypothetical protein